MSAPRKSRKFWFIIVPGVVGIATFGLIFQLLHFIPLFVNHYQYLLQTSAFLFYTLCFISYYQAIMIHSPVPATLLKPRLKNHLKLNHPLYEYDATRNECQKQNQRYKPNRTSHCHACKCVTRMDHHCPYTGGCVGAHNLKAFILFNFYGGIFALQFLVLSVCFYWKLDTVPEQLSQTTIAIWVFLSFMSALLSFGMNGIWISNLMLATKNIAQIDLLKGQFSLSDKFGIFPNPYDLGALTNLNSIFNGDYWLFWLPTEIVDGTDASQFPMRPPVTVADLQKTPENFQQLVKECSTKIDIPETFHQLQSKYESQYEGVIFFYRGKKYQLTPRQIKQQLKEINELASKQLQARSDEQHNNQQQPAQKVESNEQDRNILEDLYAND